MPALHISLGLFLKFFNMLEKEYYHIDYQIAVETEKGNP